MKSRRKRCKKNQKQTFQKLLRRQQDKRERERSQATYALDDCILLVQAC